MPKSYLRHRNNEWTYLNIDKVTVLSFVSIRDNLNSREGQADNKPVSKNYLNWTKKAFDVIQNMFCTDPLSRAIIYEELSTR